jgi:hypothetical protein
MLIHLESFDFGAYVFVDHFHMFEFGIVKRQLELLCGSMTNEQYILFVDRITSEEVGQNSF